MRRHERKDRGIMGAVILAVLGVFFAIHLMVPEVTIWPALLVVLAISTMLASHAQRNRTIRHSLASSTPKQNS